MINIMRRKNADIVKRLSTTTDRQHHRLMNDSVKHLTVSAQPLNGPVRILTEPTQLLETLVANVHQLL